MSSRWARWSSGSVDRRWALPPPPEQRAKQPFLVVVRERRMICPWQRNRPSDGDMARLDAMLAALDVEELPALLCWVWPDRKPVALGEVAHDWLKHFALGKACFALEV